MDKQGFRTLLQTQSLNEEKIEESLAIAERFEGYVHEPGRIPSAETAWAFSRLLIEEGNNTFENYVALIRYCGFIKNNEMFTALMELVDGGEVGDNLYRMVEEKFGAEVRDEVFAGIGVAPYGLPTPDKPVTLHPVLERLQAKVGVQACRDFLSASLRDLPDRHFRREKRKYQKARDIDEYLKKRHQSFVKRLKECQRQGQLFFVQEITDGDVRLVEDFCSCSGGFHKKPFEVIFGQTLKVDVLESVLKGDERCRFAIYLPEEALTGTGK